MWASRGGVGMKYFPEEFKTYHKSRTVARAMNKETKWPPSENVGNIVWKPDFKKY